METVRTKFIMSGVPTYVIVVALAENKYGCTLNLVDFFEGDEVPADDKTHHLTITILDNWTWHQVGESKVHLSSEDLQALGKLYRSFNKFQSANLL